MQTPYGSDSRRPDYFRFTEYQMRGFSQLELMHMSDEANIAQDKERERSTIKFPYGDLNDAIEVAKDIFKNGGQRGSPEQVAAWTGHKVVDSGAFRGKLATSRTFGLINVDREAISLTELGSEIVDPQRESQARVKAFMNVPLYKQIYDAYRGKILPSENAALEAEVVRLGVAKKQADKARQAFQRSADQAGFFAHGKDRLIMPTRIQPAAGSARMIPPDGGEPATERHQERHHENKYPAELHPFIRGLLETLPSGNNPFPKAKREQWLQTARHILDLLYKESGEADD